MLRSECRRVFKDLLLLGLVFSALAAGCAWTDKATSLTPTLELVLLLFSAYMGWSLLDRERQDGSVEYILSLPLSRWGILGRKLFPRLIAILVPLGAYRMIHASLNLPGLLEPWPLTAVYAAFFLIGLSLSLSLSNYISAIFFILLIHPGQIMLMKLADPILPLSNAIEYAGITAIALALLFVILFRTWDIRPASVFHRRFLPPALLTILLVPFLIFMAYGRSWGVYYLSGNNTLIRAACGRSEAVSGNHSWRFSKCMTTLQETNDGHLYLATRVLKKGSPCRITGLMRFSPRNGSWQQVAPLPEGWRLLVGAQGETGARVGNRHYFSMISERDPGKAAILEVEGVNLRLLPLDGEISHKWFAVLIVSDPGDRFILQIKDTIWKWSPGSPPVELFSGDEIAVWKERIMVMDETQFRIFRLSEEGLEEELQRPGAAQWVRRWGSSLRARHVLFRQGGKVRHVDLEFPEPRTLELDITPISYAHGPEGLTVVSRDEERLRIDTWNQGKPSTRYWKPSLDFRVVGVYDSGIVVFNSRHFEVHRFE